jgi:hypothetical protein
VELVDIDFEMIANIDFVGFDELDDDNILPLSHIVLGNYYKLDANDLNKSE